MIDRIRARGAGLSCAGTIRIESLESRTLLTAGNILIATSGSGNSPWILEYSQSGGAPVRSISVNYTDVGWGQPHDVTVDSAGRIQHVFGSTFLGTYQSSAWAWHQALNWKIYGTTYAGAVTSWGKYIYAQSMDSGPGRGIMRFDTSNNYAAELTNFPNQYGYDETMDVTMGMDGLLYAVIYNSYPANQVYALNPQTMEVVKKVSLVNGNGTFAVADAQGNIYTFGQGFLTKLSPTGALIKQIVMAGRHIDISDDGKLVLIQSTNAVILDLNLNVQTFFPIQGAYWGEVFVSWASYQTPKTYDPVPPAVASSRYAYEKLPNCFEVTFSEDVTGVDAGDLTVQRLGSGETYMPDLASYDAATRTASFRFVSRFANGNYRATLAAGSVADLAGNTLGSAAQADFFSLTGDVNHDRSINFIDLVAVAQNYGRTGAGWSDGDFDGDGTVSFIDLVTIAQNYNTALPAATMPVAVIPASSAPAAEVAVPAADDAVAAGGGDALAASTPAASAMIASAPGAVTFAPAADRLLLSDSSSAVPLTAAGPIRPARRASAGMRTPQSDPPTPCPSGPASPVSRSAPSISRPPLFGTKSIRRRSAVLGD